MSEESGEDDAGGHGGGGSMRWLLTYADMITLLMAFFILLYSMSVINKAKFNQLAISVRSGFGGAFKGMGMSIISLGHRTSSDPGIVLIPRDVARKMEETRRVVENIEHSVASSGMSNAVGVYRDARGLVINFRSEGLMFERGSATLTPQAKALLSALTSHIRKLPNPVRAEGHTCDLPIHTAQFPSNWELSTARATAVVRYLIREGRISPERLSAAGYADSHPLLPNDNEPHREINRRVELVILSTPEENSDSGSVFQDPVFKGDKLWQPKNLQPDQSGQPHT